MKNEKQYLRAIKDSNSIFQITLLKIIIVIYFLFILLNSLGSSGSFFHDNAEFGFWAFVSFVMFSGFILAVDIIIILLTPKSFKYKRVYILVIQAIICLIVYFGLNYMFKNADKWNEHVFNETQRSQVKSSDIQLQELKLKNKYNQTFIDGLKGHNESIKLIDNYS